MASFNIRRNVVITVAAFFVNIMLTFIGFRLVIQECGTAALGLWSALTAVIYIIRMGDVGMGSAAERHIATIDAQIEPIRARGYLDTALLLNAGLFLSLALIGWVLLTARIEWIVPSDSKSQTEAIHILPLILAGLVASNITNVISGGLRGLHMGWIAAYLSVGGGLVQMGIILVLVPVLGLAGLAWAQLIQSLLIGLSGWMLLNRHLIKKSGVHLSSLPKTGTRSLLQELFRFSIRAQVINLTNGLLEPASKLIVGHSAGMSILGIYEMAYKIVSLPRNAVVSGVLSMSPAMTRMLASEPIEAIKLYRQARRMVTIITGCVLFLVVVGSPLISSLIFKKNDTMLIVFVSILAIGFWLNAIGAPAYTIGFSLDRMQANLTSTLISLTLLLILGFLFQKFSPAYGPVIATSFSIGFGGIFILWRNQLLIITN